MVSRSCRSRGSQRALHDRASLRPFLAALAIDEASLAAHVKPLLTKHEKVFKANLGKGVPHQEALLQCSRQFQDEFSTLCYAALVQRDQRILALLNQPKAAAAEALRAIQVLGALVPPWQQWKPGEEKRVVRELEAALDETRSTREHNLRSNLVRSQTTDAYSSSRFRPRQLHLPGVVEHVLSAADVARLRAGETLVLDPEPALLAPNAMATAMADLMRLVRSKSGVLPSRNPCNTGSFHGMLPVNPQANNHHGLSPATCTLLRKLAALPALIERHGWRRTLAVPSMVQLGFYPGGSGARYRPHLDRWPSEVDNRRELTILVYVNVGWDAKRHGGCLRLHPPESDGHGGGGGSGGGGGGGGPAAEGGGSGGGGGAAASLTQATTTIRDVEPIAGRVVIFQSGQVMHEVLESAAGADRVALTLWVEYEDDWREEERLQK